MTAGDVVTAQAWLDIWEAASALPPGLREAELLHVACTADRGELARLPLGTRDRLLLDLRRALFGPRMNCVASCPACGERCEWNCAVDALVAPAPAPAEAGRFEWCSGGWVVRFRPVDGLDLAALRTCADADAARRCLLERCVLQAAHDGVPVGAGALPDDVVAALASAMADADPQAAMSVALVCPACRHAWDADFDPGAFVWTELDAWAQRALSDVHLLATRYGWSEREVLTLTPARRARYLAMVSA